jgi:FMN phosphatase YigB (HAD superfamily)
MNPKRERPMLKAVLIDLDNTLILFDEIAFYQRFMERIIPYFDGLVPGEEFRDRLLRGIRGLLQNDGEMVNQDFFMNIFCQGCENRREAVWERFMAFYLTEYEKIPVDVKIPPGLQEVLEALRSWNLAVVVATNPLFPEIAQFKRMAWGGLDPECFAGVTHLGNSNYVKPRKEYYRQICDRMGLPPDCCLMVGNDSINDMVAGTLGMKTYLTTESEAFDYGAVTKGRSVRPGQKYPADHSGTLLAVLDVVAGACKV